MRGLGLVGSPSRKIKGITRRSSSLPLLLLQNKSGRKETRYPVDFLTDCLGASIDDQQNLLAMPGKRRALDVRRRTVMAVLCNANRRWFPSSYFSFLFFLRLVEREEKQNNELCGEFLLVSMTTLIV